MTTPRPKGWRIGLRFACVEVFQQAQTLRVFVLTVSDGGNVASLSLTLRVS